MCGILGLVAQTPANQLLYDGLLVLQHRGQDAAGIVTAEDNTFHMHKGEGLVGNGFRPETCVPSWVIWGSAT